MMVLIVAALLGVFIRQTLIRVLASAIVISLNEKGEIACNATVLGTLIIRSVQKEINRTVPYLKNREIEVNDGSLEKVTAMLSNYRLLTNLKHVQFTLIV